MAISLYEALPKVQVNRPSAQALQKSLDRSGPEGPDAEGLDETHPDEYPQTGEHRAYGHERYEVEVDQVPKQQYKALQHRARFV